MNLQTWNERTIHPAELVSEESDDNEFDDPRTEVEKRLEWLCDAWADALTDDTHDEWFAVRMMIYGAQQTLVHCKDRERFETSVALREISEMAFENSLECIKAGKYQGATA